MTDPLDDLRRAFDGTTPVPDPERRASTLARAMGAFDDAQGLAARTRPTRDRPNAWATIRYGVGRMLATLARRPAITAATALAAVALVALVPILRDQVPSPPAFHGSSADAIPEVPAPPAAILSEDATRDLVADSAVSVTSIAAPETRVLERRERSQAQSGLRMRRAPGAETAKSFGGGRTLSLTTEAIEPFPDVPLLDTTGDAVFANDAPNRVRITAEEPVSTFSIDVDTASYSMVRAWLMDGYLPPKDAVRIEEMINYFPYSYPAPQAGEAPFKPTVTVAPTPWNPHTELLHIALQGRIPATDDRPPLNLVFLIDTSGSMDEPSKLPLLVQSFRLMLGQLRPEDEVAIVAYAGSAGLVLDATPASNRRDILHALENLYAGGSTAGAEGVQLAYRTAQQMTADEEVTRVILATDGDFNVGISDPVQLTDFIARKRESGIYLSVLGFGRNHMDDAIMQALAQNGNGQAAFIDTLSEAQKVLVDQLTGALFPIAEDVKIQVEFNPAVVAEYRLIGYETRQLQREDFNNDKVDAGEIGAGHSVTAIYEITPIGSPAVLNTPLRYASPSEEPNGQNGELAFLRLRYKEPGDDTSQLVEVPISPAMGEPNAHSGFAAAMAGFGQILRGGTYLGNWSYMQAIALAEANRARDPFGYRHEAIKLMRLAASIAEIEQNSE